MMPRAAVVSELPNDWFCPAHKYIANDRGNEGLLSSINALKCSPKQPITEKTAGNVRDEGKDPDCQGFSHSRQLIKKPGVKPRVSLKLRFGTRPTDESSASIHCRRHQTGVDRTNGRNCCREDAKPCRHRCSRHHPGCHRLGPNWLESRCRPDNR